MADHSIEDHNIMLEAEINNLKAQLEEYEQVSKDEKKIVKSWHICIVLAILINMENQHRCHRNCSLN